MEFRVMEMDLFFQCGMQHLRKGRPLLAQDNSNTQLALNMYWK